MRGDPRIARTGAVLSARRIDKALATTDGIAVTQTLVRCGAGLQAIAVDGDEVQVRSYPIAHGGDARAAGWEHVLGLDLAGQRPAGRGRGGGAAVGAAVPGGPANGRPRRRAAGAPDPRVDRPRARARPHAARRGVLRGDELGAASDLAGPGRCATAAEHLGVTADATVPGGLGTFGWDDEGVPGTADAADRGRGAACGAERPHGRGEPSALAASGGCARADGFARQPIVRMTNVSVEPGVRGLARRPARRHGRGAVLRDQPLLVDRRPPPAVPVRDRGLPRDPRRRAGPALPQRLLRRADAAILGLARRRLRTAGVAAVGADELRQGRARADHGGLPRGGAGALPRRPGGRCVTAAGEQPLELAERALGHLETDGQVTVTRERSLVARFARSVPTQATDVDDLTVHVLAWRRRPPGRCGDQPHRRRRAARRSRGAPQAPPVRRGDAAGSPGDHPGLPGPPPAYRPHDGFDPATARDGARSAARRSATTVFAGAAGAGLEAFGIWTAGAVATAIASLGGDPRRRPRHRRAPQGRLPRRARAQRLGCRNGGRRPRRSTPTPSRAARPRRWRRPQASLPS